MAREKITIKNSSTSNQGYAVKTPKNKYDFPYQKTVICQVEPLAPPVTSRALYSRSNKLHAPGQKTDDSQLRWKKFAD